MPPLVGRIGRTARGLGRRARSSPIGAAAVASGTTVGSRASGVGGGILGAWDSLGPRTRAGLFLTGAGFATANAFQGGVSQTTEGNIGDAFYETLTGNPDIDREIFGMDMNPMSLLLPTPTILAGQRSAMGMGTVGAGTGAVMGMGSALATRRFGRVPGRGFKGALIGGAVGLAASLGPSERRQIRLAMQPETINRHIIAQREGYHDEKNYPIMYEQQRRQRYGNAMPTVNGQMVIGMYNSRGR